MNQLTQQEEPDINEALDIEPEETVEQPSALMQEAMDGGYKDKEAFVEAGGDPEKHVSPHEFVRYGKLQKSMREQQRRMDQKEQDYEQRFKHLNEAHKVQLDQKITALEAKQRAAVEEADSEAYDAAQTEINSLKDQHTDTADTTPPKDPLVAEWEEKNDWIDDPEDLRTNVAQGAWNAYLQRNPEATAQQVLTHVDKQLAKMPKPTNLLRDQPSSSETSERPSSRKKGLSMSDLNQEERDLWSSAGQAIWKGDEKAFLKSAADARK